MDDHVEAALELLERATDAAGADVRENVRNVEAGLTELAGGDRDGERSPDPDRVEEVAEKLAGLERETDGETRELLRAARTHVEAYEREL